MKQFIPLMGLTLYHVLTSQLTIVLCVAVMIVSPLNQGIISSEWILFL